MTSKREELYEAVLRHVKERAGNIARPGVIISDYEQGLMNAARTVFPTAHSQGCFFHYSQVICSNNIMQL